MQKKKKFNPDGAGYDYDTAIKGGAIQDSTKHWPSRDPNTGQILKGRKHKTWRRTVNAEFKAGFEIYKGKDGKYYSRKIK